MAPGGPCLRRSLLYVYLFLCQYEKLGWASFLELSAILTTGSQICLPPTLVDGWRDILCLPGLPCRPAAPSLGEGLPTAHSSRPRVFPGSRAGRRAGDLRSVGGLLLQDEVDEARRSGRKAFGFAQENARVDRADVSAERSDADAAAARDGAGRMQRHD